MPSPSYWPFVLALGLPIMGYGFVFKYWWLLAIGALDRVLRDQRVDDRARDRGAAPLMAQAVVTSGESSPVVAHERPVRRRRHVDGVRLDLRFRIAGCTRCRPAACTSRPSSSSVYLRCQNSSRCSTIGTSAKLYSGGGDEVDPLERARVPRVVGRRLGRAPGRRRSRSRGTSAPTAR